MATKRSLLGYQGLNYSALTTHHGDRLETLTAQDKLDMGAGLLLWQSYDTELQANGMEGGIAFSEFLQEHLPINNSTDAYTALELLAEQCIDETEALKLVITLCHQLLEGVYLR